MANSQFIGRRVSVGLGIETTPGTEVAPSEWLSHLGLDFQRKTTTITNDSAQGRVEKSNDSIITETWAEGTLSGKVQDIGIGFLLYQLFASVSTAANADASGTVKDHTFSVAQTNVPPTLTLVRKDPVSNRRHGLATLDSLEITGDQGDWVKFSAQLKAKQGVTGTDVPAYTNESEFALKHVTAKLATNVAGLGAATALQIKSFRLTLSRPASPFFPAGQSDPSVYTTGAWEVTGELVLQYNDSALETTWFANTQQALSITLANTDLTIGTAARPALAFTMPKVRLNSFGMSDDLDNVVEQTVGFTAELDAVLGYLIQAKLTNTKALYA